jgi:hypothetical protein
MFNMTGKRALKVLYESYRQQFDSYMDFKKYLLKNTGDLFGMMLEIENQLLKGDTSLCAALRKSPNFE